MFSDTNLLRLKPSRQKQKVKVQYYAKQDSDIRTNETFEDWKQDTSTDICWINLNKSPQAAKFLYPILNLRWDMAWVWHINWFKAETRFGLWQVLYVTHLFPPCDELNGMVHLLGPTTVSWDSMIISLISIRQHDINYTGWLKWLTTSNITATTSPCLPLPVLLVQIPQALV